MLSHTCKAAIKAVIFLASRFSTGERAGITEVSDSIEENGHTVGKMMQTLVNAGVINSAKGPGGGFYITKEQLKKPVITIIDAVDGKDVFRACALGLKKCSSSHPCPVHHEYKKGRDAIETLFRKTRIHDLSEQVVSGMVHLAN